MERQDSKRTVKVFAAASFLNDMGSDMIYPIWPLFVTSILHANMAALGFLDGLGDALVSLSQAASGYWSDRLKKRKVFIWIGYFCGAISRIGYGLSTHWLHLIPFRILDRTGKMRGAPRDAMIADVSTRENRGENFGLLRTMDNLGAVVGILICIFFFGVLGYRNLFLLAALPSLVGTGLILALIKDRPPVTQKEFRGLNPKDLDPNFWLVLFSGAIFALGNFSYSFLLIYARDFGFKLVFIPGLYLIFTAFASLSSLPFGKLADRVGRKPIVLVAFLLWAVVTLILMFYRNWVALVLTFIVYGLHKGALDTAQKTFVSELVPAELRATGLGFFQVVVGFCALPASVVAGLLWDKIDKMVPLYFAFGLTVIAIFLLSFVKETPEKRI